MIHHNNCAQYTKCYYTPCETTEIFQRPYTLCFSHYILYCVLYKYIPQASSCVMRHALLCVFLHSIYIQTATNATHRIKNVSCKQTVNYNTIKKQKTYNQTTKNNARTPLVLLFAVVSLARALAHTFIVKSRRNRKK